jgi:hypothetical protein
MFAIAVISLLLQSQSPLLPSRLEDEYFKRALRMIGWFRSLMLFWMAIYMFLKPNRWSAAIMYNPDLI